MKGQRANLDPSKPAVVAMWVWGAHYAAQGGGSMDFWWSLTKRERTLCRDLVERLADAREELKSEASK